MTLVPIKKRATPVSLALMRKETLNFLCFNFRDGRVAQLENIYVRGSKIRFLILPDMLKNAPMLKNMATRGRGGGADRGKSAILRNQAGMGGRGRGGDRGGRGRGGFGDRGGGRGGFGDRGGRGGFRGDRH